MHKVSGRADEGSVRVHPLLEGVGSFISVDSATSPSASRRMTGGREA